MDAPDSQEKEDLSQLLAAAEAMTHIGDASPIIISRVIRAHELLNEVPYKIDTTGLLYRSSNGTANFQEMSKSLLVGRLPKIVDEINGCDLVLDDKSVGRRHFSITHSEAGYSLLNLHSSGTFVNGRYISEVDRVFLTSGDEICAGQTNLVFYICPDPNI